MSSERECGCGRKFRKGMKALVSEGNDGRLVRKTVCMRCARLSERVVLRGAARVCSVPDCDHIADVCKAHVTSALFDERTNGMALACATLSGMINASALTQKRGDADDFVDGRIEGMQTALAIMMQGTSLGPKS